jgi:hypothetical protein
MLEEYQARRTNGESEPKSSVSMSVQEKFANCRPTSGNYTVHSAGSQVRSVDNDRKE